MLDSSLKAWYDFKYGEMHKLPKLPPPVFISSRKKMPDIQITIPLAENGYCLIHCTFLHNAGTAPVIAMIDTGATDSIISTRIVEELGIDTVSAGVEIRAFDASREARRTQIGLQIPGLFEGKENFALSCYLNENIGHDGFDIILGCDFLHFFTFLREPQKATFSLNFHE